MKIKHETIFVEFTETVPHAILMTWKAAIELWEADPYKNPDPFVEQTSCKYFIPYLYLNLLITEPSLHSPHAR